MATGGQVFEKLYQLADLEEAKWVVWNGRISLKQEKKGKTFHSEVLYTPG